ncbi:MAG: ribonuclease catalytic domain-containing protein [Candidatus Micrarchaeota archaeon]|nr:ribonuclease catalytic domain-containing protein [Candidatus Micrarchaeota archaeon]
MSHLKNPRSKSKARWRTDSRAPGKSGSHGKPSFASEEKTKNKYKARAQYKPHKKAVDPYEHEPKVTSHSIALAAMEKYGFVSEFPLVVDAKANTLDELTVKKVGATVRDLRGLLWSSIDNFGTSDMDQLEFCERGQGGEILVKIAISDVDAYAPKGSLLDQHAKINATTVYAGKEEFPMFPERLSKDLSSFHMDQDRLAIVIEFAVLPRGNIRAGKIYRAVVRNKAQFSYEEISAWLDEKEPAPEMMDEIEGMEEQIRLQDEASMKLCKHRSGQGASDSEKQEAAAKDGKTLGLYVADADRAKRIVESFMIGAASTISNLLEGANGLSIRKVIIEPKAWNEIVAVASEKGVELPSDPDAESLSEFLLKQKNADSEGYSALCLAIAVSLGPGEYAVFDRRDPADCFCLAAADYAPGMAPNQRYIDVVIQRLLKAAVAHIATPYSKDELLDIAALCTERETVAKKLERAVKYTLSQESD